MNVVSQDESIHAFCVCGVAEYNGKCFTCCYGTYNSDPEGADMSYCYCLPVIKPTKDDVLATIAHYKADYAFFEIWLDYVEGADGAFVRELVTQHPGKLVLLFRRQNLEPIHQPLGNRLAMIDELKGADVLLDLDLSQRSELEHVRHNQSVIRTIVSHHDYQQTPDAPELGRIVADILSFRPVIAKLATFCQDEADALRLLETQLQFKAQKQRHIVLGMGALGLVTRIFGTLWGNELVYAPPTPAGSSASGQLTRQQLEAIFQVLEPQ